MKSYIQKYKKLVLNSLKSKTSFVLPALPPVRMGGVDKWTSADVQARRKDGFGRLGSAQLENSHFRDLKRDQRQRITIFKKKIRPEHCAQLIADLKTQNIRQQPPIGNRVPRIMDYDRGDFGYFGGKKCF